MLTYYWQELCRHLSNIWWVLRKRPFFTCPFCGGSSGRSDYWGEWLECSYCWEPWHSEADDHGLDLCVGSVSFWHWLKGKLALKLGYWDAYHGNILHAVMCHFGWHKWYDEWTDKPYQETLCRWCLTSKTYEEKKNGRRDDSL